MMTEFLHEVVKKREREQEHRNLMPRSYLDELSRQMQESYNRMTAQAVGTIPATNTWRVDNLTTIHGMIAVRTPSLSQVDAYIRANIERHSDNLSRETTQHSHQGGNMQWVLEHLSSARFTAGLGRVQFTYSCSLCGQRVICSESVSIEGTLSGITVR